MPSICSFRYIALLVANPIGFFCTSNYTPHNEESNILKYILIVIFSFIISNDSLAADLTIATFNVEFLIKSRVHMRYGVKELLPKNFTEEEKAQWTDEFRNGKYQVSVNIVAPIIVDLNADILLLVETGNY